MYILNRAKFQLQITVNSFLPDKHPVRYLKIFRLQESFFFVFLFFFFVCRTRNQSIEYLWFRNLNWVCRTVFLLEGLREDLLLCLFQLLEAAAFLGLWPSSIFKACDRYHSYICSHLHISWSDSPSLLPYKNSCDYIDPTWISSPSQEP